MTSMKHKYPADMDNDLWTDLQRLKELTQTSINSLLTQGARQLIRDRVAEISQMRKSRDFLESMVSV